jgi:hypothetical protein
MFHMRLNSKEHKMKKKIFLLIVFSALLLKLVQCQEEDDLYAINSKWCGLPSQRAAQMVQKRYTSSQAARDQRDWGWTVLILDKEGKMISGSLINSQWVLSQAYLSEYEQPFV